MSRVVIRSKSDPDNFPYLLTFTKSPDHASVTRYEAWLRISGGDGTVIAKQFLGVPPPDAQGMCSVSLKPLYDLQSSGNYTVSVATTTAGGTTDSAESNAFTLPIV